MEPAMKVFETPFELASALAERLAQALLQGGTALLAGGRSPLAAYRRLAGQADLPWERITLLPTDERVLPSRHVDRNDTKLLEIFGDKGCTVQGLPFGEVDHSFEKRLLNFMPFAVTLLGLGEDGHTASLFPGHAALEATGLWVAVDDAPKPPRRRVSLTFRTLENTAELLFCVTGSQKEAPLRQLLDGEDIPAARLRPKGGFEIYCDRSALPR